MKETLSQKRSRANAARKTRGGGGARPGAGRPREKSRCPCQANTLRRAAARKFDCCRKAGGVSV